MIFLFGVAVGMTSVLAIRKVNTPKFTRIGTGYAYQHVEYPVCPDGHVRIVQIPERDEVNMLTILCLEGNVTDQDSVTLDSLKPEEQ